MSTSPKEQFDLILKKERVDDLRSFIESLDSKGRKEVAKAAKSHKSLWEYKWINRGNRSFRGERGGSEKQIQILLIALFTCGSLKDFTSQWETASELKFPILEDLLKWYQPTWIDKYLNDPGEWPRYDYNQLMKIQALGHIQLRPETVALTLPQAVRERRKDHKLVKTLDNLVRFDLTSEEHIWYLFQYESSIHWVDNYVNYDKPQEKHIWLEAFEYLIEKGKVKRIEVLKEAILASNRNFNQTQSGWFIGLFESLNPTSNEIIDLQDDLYSVMISPHSKVVNVALKMLKRIQDYSDFKIEDYINSVSILIGSEVKSVVKSVIVSLDKIAKKYPEKNSEIVHIVLMALSNPDDDIQLRAAKLIARLGDNSITTEVAMYWCNLKGKSKEELKRYNQVSEEAGMANGSVLPTLEDNSLHPVEFPKGIEDLVFLLTQTLENNEPIQMDVAIAGVIKYSPRLQVSDIPRLEPAFQRAQKRLRNEWGSRTGYLDILFCNFIILYQDIIKSWFPKQTKHLKSTELGGANIASPVYDPIKSMLKLALRSSRRRSILPLLSTPTHHPCWINPEVLIERLKKYHEWSREPDAIDFQIAIMRLNPDLVEKMDYWGLPSKWTEPVKHVIEGTPIQRNSTVFSATASLIKMPLKIEAISVSERKSKANQWNYQKNKMEEVETSISGMHFEFKRPSVEVNDKGFISSIFKSKNQNRNSILQSHRITDSWLWLIDNDILRLLSTMPRYVDQFISSIMSKCMMHERFWSEIDKRIVQNTLYFLSEIWHRDSEVVQVFLGSCMMTSDSTCRSLARDIWIDQVSKNGINADLVGLAIARFNEKEYVPLKRFSDLANECYNVSNLHKNEMGALIRAYLVNLNAETSPRNLKALLTILVECSGEIAIGQEVLMKLKKLETPSTKKLIESFHNQILIQNTNPQK